MMHWLASKSNEYCFCGNTAALSPCGVGRSCPGLDGFAAVWDISFVKALTLRGTLGAVFEAACSRTAFSRAHRKKPANAAPREFGYRLPATVSGGSFRTKPVPVEAGFPEDQTRRMKSWGHWLRAGLHTGELVFFRLKLRIVTLFPCFRTSKFDLFLMQNTPKCFETDLRDNLLGNKVFAKFLQRPSLKWAPQKIRRAFSCFSDKCLVVFGEFMRSTRSWLGFQSFKTPFIKVFDNRPNMMFRIVNQFGNRRYFISLIGGQHHLGTADLNSTGTAAENPLNLLALADTKVSGVQTHKKSLSMLENIEFFLRVCLYNTHLCMAQVLNSENVKIIF